MPPPNQPPEQLPTASYTFSPQGQIQPQLQVQPQPQSQSRPQDQAQGQPRVSRRSLLRGGLVGGGIGLAVAAGAGAAVGITRNQSQTSLKPAGKPVVLAPMPANATKGPLVVYINDSATGVLDVFAGTGATQIHNPALVTQLLASLK